jgi:hypothetical protein
MWFDGTPIESRPVWVGPAISFLLRHLGELILGIGVIKYKKSERRILTEWRDQNDYEKKVLLNVSLEERFVYIEGVRS